MFLTLTSELISFALLVAFRHDVPLGPLTSPRTARPILPSRSTLPRSLPSWASYLKESGRPNSVDDRALPSRTNASVISPRRLLPDSFPRSTRSSPPTARLLNERSTSNVLRGRPCRYGHSAARSTQLETRPTWEAGTCNSLHSTRSVREVSRPGSFT